MFLYYMRRYHRKFIRTYSKPYHDGYWEYDFVGDYLIIPLYSLKWPKGIISDAHNYPYLDFMMQEVQNRKEAFQAINLFMDANQLITNNTTVFKGTNGDEKSTYVSLWNRTGYVAIAACFVYSEEKRKNELYYFGGRPGKGLRPFYGDDYPETCIPRPDSYYTKYIEAIQGGRR